MCGLGIGGNEHRLRSEAAQLRGKGVGAHRDFLSTLVPVQPVFNPLSIPPIGGGGVVVVRDLVLNVSEHYRSVDVSSYDICCSYRGRWSELCVDPPDKTDLVSASCCTTVCEV